MAASDDEIIVQLTMQAEQFQAAAKEAGVTTEGLAAQLNAANVDILAQGAALTRLDAAFNGPITTAKQLAAAESALDEAMRTGAISAEQQAAYLDQLAASQAAAAEATQLNTAATEELTAAQTISGGVAREVGVLIGELARGNYTRLEGSTITLANRTGLLSQVFSPMGVAIMGAAGAALFLGDQFLKAQETADAFNRSLLVTGNLVGMTAGELNGLAMKIGDFTGNTQQADELVQKLAQSGKLSGQTLQYAAQAAANAMQLTGESADQAAREVESLAGNPTKAVVDLNGKYHFLTLEIYEQISKLQSEGDAFGAAEVAAKAFLDVTSDRLDTVTDKMGFFERQVSDFKRGFDAIDQGLRKAFDPTLEEQSAEATHKAVEAQYELQQVIKANGNLGGDDAKQAIAQARQYAEETRKAALLLRFKVEAERESAQQQAKTAQQNTKLIQEVNEQDKLNQHLKETSLLQEKIAEEKQRVEDIHKNSPNDSSIKGITFDASGAVAGGEQWTAIITKLTKEYSNLDEEARKSARDAAAAHRKAASEAMNDLQEQRDGTQANTAERIQADAAILASATKLYGAMSSQQKQALAQMISDGRAYDDAVMQQESAVLQTQMRVGQAAANEKRTEAQQALADHEITAQQALAIEEAANQQALNSYAQYIAAKIALDQGSVAALNKDAQDWVSFSSGMTKRMQSDQQATAKQIQAQWMQTFRPITQAFDSHWPGAVHACPSAFSAVQVLVPGSQ